MKRPRIDWVPEMDETARHVPPYLTQRENLLDEIEALDRKLARVRLWRIRLRMIAKLLALVGVSLIAALVARGGR